MARDTILVVDDEEINIDLFKLIFKDKYKIESCNDGKEALEFLTKHHKSIAAIMLDLVMPGVDGLVLLKVLNAKNITKMIPVVIVTATTVPDAIVECFENGAADYVTKPFVSVVVRERVRNIIEMFHYRQGLELKVNEQTGKIKAQNVQLQGYNDRIIEVMSSIVEFRNLETNMHIKRIKGMTRIMAEMTKRLYPDKYNLTDKEIATIESASALHDIGKIAISDTILLKPGRLSVDEFEVIKSHTTHGCEIIDQIANLQDSEYIRIGKNICRHHHERYDGNGYPDNLAGEDIPIEAQLVSIVDAYEALVGERVYRDAFDKNKAFDMIINGECGMFSDTMLDVFTKSKPLLEKLCDKYSGEIV